MDEREFNGAADLMLARIESALEPACEQCDFDFELLPGGVIELDFGARGGKIVVNRHAAAREIWVAARSGGYHFRLDALSSQAACWRDTRDGVELLERLALCMSEQAGTKVTLG
jgi:CyaY protein